MEVDICYMACKASVEEMGAAFDLALTPPEAARPTWGGSLAHVKASGWTVLVCDDTRFGQERRDQLARLSEAFDVYLCEVNQAVMHSSAARWRDGAEQWSVRHAGDRGNVFDLTCSGALPPEFAELRAQYEGCQRDERGEADHIFDIPLALAALEIGFRHDERIGPEGVEGLRYFALKRKSMFVRLFAG